MAEAKYVTHRPNTYEREHEHDARVAGVDLVLREHVFLFCFFLVDSKITGRDAGLVQPDVGQRAAIRGADVEVRGHCTQAI